MSGTDRSPAARAELRKRALSAYERGDEDRLERIAEALHHLPYDGGLLIADARARSAAGDPNPTDRLTEVLRQAPDWLDGHVALAQLRWETGQRGIFLEEFEAALRRLPGHAGLWLRYLNAIAGSGDAGRAADVARRLRQSGGDNPALRLIEARNAGTAGQFARAGKLLETVPDNLPDKLPEAARHRLRLGDPVAAVAILDRLRANGAMDTITWALAELAWRASGDPRHTWLVDLDRHVCAIDIAISPAERDALAVVLRELHHATGRPLGQSVREGTQTRGNLWRRGEPEIASLHERLTEAVRTFAANLPALDAEHPLRPCVDGALALTTGWSVRLRGGGHHISHIHAHGVLSSACYIALPAEAAGREGWLELGRPPEDIPLALPPLAVLEPRPRRLILFPSYLYHGTVSFRAGERLSVAFDAAPLSA